MVTWGEGQLAIAVGALMNSRESHNAMLPGWDFVTRKQAEPSALRPVHRHGPLFQQKTQIYGLDCCSVFPVAAGRFHNLNHLFKNKSFL